MINVVENTKDTSTIKQFGPKVFETNVVLHFGQNFLVNEVIKLGSLDKRAMSGNLNVQNFLHLMLAFSES